MKNIIFILGASFLSIPFITIAQVKSNVIKTNIFGVFAGQFQLGYERVLNEKMSVQLMPGLVTFSSSGSSSDFFGTDTYSATTSGFIIVPEFRFYPTYAKNDVPKGFYAAPFFRLRMVTQDYYDTGLYPDYKNVSYVDKTTTIGGGLVLGYQFLMGDVFSFDIFISPQYKEKSTNRTYDDPNVTDDDFNRKYLQLKVKEKSGGRC